MEYIVQHKSPSGWVTLAPIKRGRSGPPYRFSSALLAADFLLKFYPKSFDAGNTRIVSN